MSATARDDVQRCLEGVGFPASRDDLLDAAIRRGDPTAVQALREIPEAEYASLADVVRAVAPDGPGR
ncbi:DUF2795 domain-containing protein [Saccharothrix algeriensis]|uniref:DUF2795 domain-containing protein n=1 Tax=Saccharothrix algeriensis TaxID=173560 RepID=A0A8T8HVW1_9PSEU|nr:DUF2795 domain-containing protein [Saccharothrix algeriensis]MBM7814266.1 hypothetical protein [Saccharothrix algeriensis]QTR02616.1 DUF2795 domain-containing protein [Saccharothrix algeriensis]